MELTIDEFQRLHELIDHGPNAEPSPPQTSSDINAALIQLVTLITNMKQEIAFLKHGNDTIYSTLEDLKEMSQTEQSLLADLRQHIMEMKASFQTKLDKALADAAAGGTHEDSIAAIKELDDLVKSMILPGDPMPPVMLPVPMPDVPANPPVVPVSSGPLEGDVMPAPATDPVITPVLPAPALPVTDHDATAVGEDAPVVSEPLSGDFPPR